MQCIVGNYDEAPASAETAPSSSVPLKLRYSCGNDNMQVWGQSPNLHGDATACKKLGLWTDFSVRVHIGSFWTCENIESKGCRYSLGAKNPPIVPTFCSAWSGMEQTGYCVPP